MSFRGPHAYASCTTLAMHEYKTPHIVLTLCGPKGGLRCSEAIAVEEARRLRDRLNAAIEEAEQKSNKISC